MILADKIIKGRKKLGMSQEELAEKMEVSRQAVSKWESNQSVPEIEKILLLSKLFNVTTDYLLKDEIENDEGILDLRENKPQNSKTVQDPADTLADTVVDEASDKKVRTVTVSDAEEFISIRRNAAKKIAIGTFLCILSVIPMFLMIAFSQYPVLGISEDAAGTAGLALMLIILAPAVALFIYTGSKSAPYEFIEKEPFETEKGVRDLVKERQKDFSQTYTKYNIWGTVFCLLSPVSLFVGSVSENEFIMLICLCITLIIAGIGAVFFILAGVQNECMQKLLKEGEYAESEKKANSIKGTIGAIYWLVVTAAYLLMLFLGKSWGEGWRNGYSWIIWPVAGVLFPVVMLIINIVQRKGNKDDLN